MTTSDAANETRACSIMSEQLMLVKSEREILQMIEHVNIELNQLLVEELQLRSNEIAHLEDHSSAIISNNCIMPDDGASAKKLDSASEINRQLLELGSYEKTLMVNDEGSDEEVEEEDD